MTAKKKYFTLKSLLFTAIGILLFAWVLSAVNFNLLLQNLSKIPSSYYIAILFFTTLTHLSRAIRWRQLLISAGHKPKLGTTILANMSAYFVNQGLPRVGEITRCTVLADTDKVPVQTSLGTVIAERAVDVLCMLVISGTILLSQYKLLYDFVLQFIYNPLVEYYTANSLKFIFAGLILLCVFALFLLWWRGYYRKHKHGFLSDIVKGLLDGLLSVFRLKNQWAFWAHTAFIWFMYFVMTWYWFDVFPSISSFSFTQILFIFAVGNLSRSIPIQAGSLPAYIFLVSKALLLLGADVNEAAALVLIIPGIQTLFYIVAGGGCFAFYLLLRNRGQGSEVRGR